VTAPVPLVVSGGLTEVLEALWKFETIVVPELVACDASPR
jgi:hypothetical protein